MPNDHINSDGQACGLSPVILKWKKLIGFLFDWWPTQVIPINDATSFREHECPTNENSQP